MFTVKAYYKNNEIYLLEPFPEGIIEAELSIAVLPRDAKNSANQTAPCQTAKRNKEGKVDSLGLYSFYQADDDIDVDWEEFFGLK